MNDTILKSIYCNISQHGTEAASEAVNWKIITGNMHSPWDNLRNLLYASSNISPDEVLFFNQKILIFVLFFDENIHCGYSFEAPWQDASNEYPQYMF